MFWLIAMLASVGVGAASVFVTLQRMGGNLAKQFRAAPELAPSAFAEGAYGRVTGIVSAAKPLVTPGAGGPSVLYELVVYRTFAEHHQTHNWRVVDQKVAGRDFTLAIGDAVVRVGARDAYLLSAPAHDAEHDLREQRHAFGLFRSRVRYVPVGATVQVVGTLTREVDDDPAASRDYRETATRYRLVGTRKQPLIIACESRAQPLLPPGAPS